MVLRWILGSKLWWLVELVWSPQCDTSWEKCQSSIHLAWYGLHTHIQLYQIIRPVLQKSQQSMDISNPSTKRRSVLPPYQNGLNFLLQSQSKGLLAFPNRFDLLQRLWLTQIFLGASQPQLNDGDHEINAANKCTISITSFRNRWSLSTQHSEYAPHTILTSSTSVSIETPRKWKIQNEQSNISVALYLMHIGALANYRKYLRKYLR